MMYACRMATMVSISVSKIMDSEGNIMIIWELRIMFLFRIIMMWPAIIFAVRRISSVMGRIINLISSIRNMNGISIIGVFWGIRWVMKFFFLLIIIISKMGVQDRRMMLMLFAMWDVLLQL